MTEQAGDGTVTMDFTRIQETSCGDSEFEQELFQLFLDDSAARIGVLKSALDVSDLERIHLEAHTLKGAGLNVGTLQFHQIAAELEHIEVDAIGVRGAELFAKLESEYNRVRSEITTYLATL